MKEKIGSQYCVTPQGDADDEPLGMKVMQCL